MEDQLPSVEQWFAGKNILITGGTGFIGKILIEKLMRSCPSVGKIYLLIRPKRNKSPEQRHAELVNHEIFSFSGLEYDFSKLVLIVADLSVSGMGLKEEDVKTLHEEVNIVYHVAASIKFNEPLVDAIKINTRLTRDVVELAKGIKNLDLFVHVSTAYVNCDRQFIEEKMYPPKMDWRKAIELAETADSAEVEAVAAAAFGNMPNSYTFTKHMAEHVVWDHRHELPILIFRPVIVISTKNEPKPGWSDNFSGPEMILIAIGKGIIRVVRSNGRKMDNYCPGDVTVNGIIAATWKSACHSKITHEPSDLVVNSNFIQRCADQSIELGREMIKEHPMPDILWTDYYLPVENYYLFYVLHLLFNVFPAIFFQFAVKVIKNRDVPLLKSLRKYYVMVMHLFVHFIDKEFHMESKNFDKVIAALSEKDKQIFDTIIIKENERLVDQAVKSISTILKLIGEREVSKEEGFRQQKRMYMIDRFCRAVLLATVVYYLPYTTIRSFLYQVIQSVVSVFSFFVK